MELEELVTRAKNGDQQALNQLYNDTYRQAYQVAMQMFHDENEAFDILQDSYIKAFNNLSNLKEPSKFKSWFFQIVSNTCRDYLRKRKNNPMFFSDMTYEDDNGENEIEFVDESTAFSPEENVDYSETKRLVAEMIDNLPDEQRLVLLMYYIEGLSIKEIAQSLEISENTVKSRMNYGKAPLTDTENSQNTGSSPQNAQPNIQHKKKPDVDCPAFVVMSLFYNLLPQFPQKILIFGFSFPHFAHRFVGGAEFRTYGFCLSFSGILTLDGFASDSTALFPPKTACGINSTGRVTVACPCG